MTVEDAADQGDALVPASEVVGRGVETDDALASVDEIEDGGALRFVGFQAGRVVEDDRVILREVFFGEDRVLICEISGEGSRLFGDGLQGVVAEGDRGVDETFAAVENEDLVTLGRFRGGGKIRLDLGLVLGGGIRSEAFGGLFLPGFRFSPVGPAFDSARREDRRRRGCQER